MWTAGLVWSLSWPTISSRRTSSAPKARTPSGPDGAGAGSQARAGLTEPIDVRGVREVFDTVAAPDGHRPFAA